MLAVTAVFGATAHFETAHTCTIRVAATSTAGAAIVYPEADSTQRTDAFDHITDVASTWWLSDSNRYYSPLNP